MSDPGTPAGSLASRQAQEISLRVRDHVTAATVSGAPPGGQTIVLLHAALLDRRMWASFSTSLSAALEAAAPAGADDGGYRVVAYDLRGHGAARDAPPITDVGRLATDLGDVLDALGVGSVHLCGLSFGGAVVQAFANSCPDRVRSLTLVATDLRFPADVMDSRARSFTPELRDESIETTLRRWFSPEALAQGGPEVRYARDCLLATSPEHWSATWRALGGFDAGDEVHDLRAPVLAVSGAQDTATPPARLHALAQAYRDGRHVTVDPGPHLLSLECADVLAGHVAGFLADVGWFLAQTSPSRKDRS